MSSNSDCVTRGIRVHATAAFVPERSDPGGETFVFTYHITIRNQGTETVQLRTRHWIIINAEGIKEEVNGDGVVGETPRLAPGETFSYSSFCPLNTHWGTMEGSYQFVTADGETFDVMIGRFVLAAQVSANSEMSR